MRVQPKGTRAGLAAAVERRSQLVRLVGSLVLVVGGLGLVVTSALPSHPRAVTGTVTAVASTREITVSAPGVGRLLTVQVDPGTAYSVGSPVVVTVQGDDPRTATIGDGHSAVTNLWTGICVLAAGVLFGMPLVREHLRAGRAPAG